MSNTIKFDSVKYKTQEMDLFSLCPSCGRSISHLYVPINALYAASMAKINNIKEFDQTRIAYNPQMQVHLGPIFDAFGDELKLICCRSHMLAAIGNKSVTSRLRE